MNMKGNNGKGNVVERDEWETPQELWSHLNKQYRFGYDCCTNGRNSKCRSYTTEFESDFEFDSQGIVGWMNPPFSKAYKMFKHFFNVIGEGVAIYRCDNMETKIWQEVILPNATWIFIPKGRICYEGMEGKGSRFPSALIGFNVPEPKGLKGHTTRIK